MNKKTISIMLAYVGVLTGAGLASGQELMQYFVSFGIPGLFGLGAIGIMHILVGGIILQLGSHYLADSHIDVIEEVSNKYVGKFMDFALVINCFLMGFVMIAGAGSNLNQQFGFKPWVGSLICTLLIIFIGMLDFDKVTKVIGAFTPLIILFAVIGSIYTFVTIKPDWQRLDQLSQSVISPLPNVALSTVNYFGLCMISGISMAFVLGGSKTDSAEAGLGGMLGGLMVAILTALVGFTLFFTLPIVKDSDIPMQIVLENIHPTLGLIMSLIIFGMIFNSSISLFYSAARRFSDTENKFRRNLVVFTLLGFALSFMGFKKLMSILYPILGFLGLALTIILVIAWFREKDEIKHEMRRRFAISVLTKRKLDDNEEFGRMEKEKLDRLAESSIIDNKEIKKAVHEEVKEELEEENSEEE
ncbi:YkvI family membrane protein [Anaerococcus senegalensis]|uniref:YkvI family membrane protein n=1 Tax=Anaerococcus senegalensis TaxID=1288120 RepID=UPI0003170D6D|nr:membrane protein [Anaerococcus senegalensis]